MTKPYGIPKVLVWEAYLSVKANGGSAGIDQESLGQFKENLSNNLYKLWNRMPVFRELLPATGERCAHPEEVGRGAHAGCADGGGQGGANGGQATA